MEEEKAAAYYDELSRKGEGAARFKQGLGFSTASARNRDPAVPARGSALSSSASAFRSSFVRASSPSKTAEFEKQAQLETIQNKLKKKPSSTSELQPSSRVSRYSIRSSSRERDRDRHSRRSRSRSRETRGSRHRRRSSSGERGRRRYVERERDREIRRRSRSRSGSDEGGRRRREKGRSRSASPRDWRRKKSGGDRSEGKGVVKVGKERNRVIDYAKLIEGYDNMSPAERVKAKMKFQLSEAAKKDTMKGSGSGWERFEFDKDAPLDDEEIEAAEDDVALVKHIGQSFRFSAVEAKREDQIKAAHDEAMFGASSIPLSVNNEDEIEQEKHKTEIGESAPVVSLISDKVIAEQRGSWRDRARKV